MQQGEELLLRCRKHHCVASVLVDMVLSKIFGVSVVLPSSWSLAPNSKLKIHLGQAHPRVLTHP